MSFVALSAGHSINGSGGSVIHSAPLAAYLNAVPEASRICSRPEIGRSVAALEPIISLETIMSTLTPLRRTNAPVGSRVTRHIDRLQALAGRAVARIAHEISIRRTAHHLAQLDNRMLQDIGLRRTGDHYFTYRNGDLVSLIPHGSRPSTLWSNSEMAMPLRASAQTMKRSA
jgi:uncharacterized protein YjiS (DUF1127 family)